MGHITVGVIIKFNLMRECLAWAGVFQVVQRWLTAYQIFMFAIAF